MNWLALISYFFGGIFLGNGLPHLVNGISGRAFQTPFAKPPGQGLSPSKVNVVWAFVNLIIGYVLIFKVGEFDGRDLVDVGAVFLGAFAISFMLAHHFGKFHGGNR